MALKNFIANGYYTRISDLQFNKAFSKKKVFWGKQCHCLRLRLEQINACIYGCIDA